MSAKDIVVAPIARARANALVKRVHYSGKIVANTQLHLGVFYDGKLEGAMQFGPSLDKRKLQGIVRDTKWNGFIELNRLAFSDKLPRNSESRALAIAMRMIRKQYPHIEWVVSFADGTQCGDGTIYRAAGFVLTQIKKNTSIWAMDSEVFTNVGYRTSSQVREIIHKTTVTKGQHILNKTSLTAKAAVLKLPKGGASMQHLVDAGARPLAGFQLRYVYFLNPAARERLVAPVLPFSKIDEMGASMYRGRARRKSLRRAKQAMAGDHPEQRQGGTDPHAPISS